MLHIINKSPADMSQLSYCRQFLADGDAVLLVESGVYTTLSHASIGRLLDAADISIYALIADLKARGIDNSNRSHGDYQCIDYAGFVQLVVAHPLIQSW